MEPSTLLTSIIDALAQPCSGENPWGHSFLESAHYDLLLISKHSLDDLPKADWISTDSSLSLNEYIHTCIDVLCHESKDLQVICLLTLALTKKFGLEGLCVGFEALNYWFESCWAGGFPALDSSDPYSLEERWAKLIWLDQYLSNYLNQSPPLSSKVTFTDINAVASRFQQHTNDKFPEHGVALKRIAKFLHTDPSALVTNLEPVATEVVSNLIDAVGIDTRQQAIEHLRKAFVYFKQYEPYGPIAPMLERVIVWSEKSIDQWLGELVQDESTRRKVRDTLGIEVGK